MFHARKTLRTILWSAVLLLSAKNAIAADSVSERAFNLYISAGGGLSTLLYKPQLGDYRVGFGGAAGLGAAYHCKMAQKHFEISAGLEAAVYNAKTDVFSYTHTTESIADMPYEPFKVKITLTGYEERQRAVLLNVPVMLRQHFNISSYNFFWGAGVKIGVPITSEYKVERGNIAAKGSFDIPIEDPNGFEYGYPPEMGFSPDNAPYSAQALNNSPIIAGILAMLALEFGASWQLGQRATAYAALYADIGLNNVRQGSTAAFVGYYPQDAQSAIVRTSSIVTSLRTDNGAAMAKRIAPIAAGIKVSVYFGRKKQLVAPSAQVRTDTIFKRDTLWLEKKDTIEKIVERIVERHDTIIKYDDAAPAPTPEPVLKAPFAAADTTMPKHLVQIYVPDTIDRDKNMKKTMRRSYQVQVLASRAETDMSYFDLLRRKYPHFRLRRLAVGRAAHYTYGMFSTFDEARKWAYRYAALGYTDVFVIQVEGERITKSYYNNKQ